MGGWVLVLSFVAVGATACTRADTTRPCASPETCEQETPLCYNSCSRPGAASGCADCCTEMRRKCLNCEDTAFNECD